MSVRDLTDQSYPINHLQPFGDGDQPVMLRLRRHTAAASASCDKQFGLRQPGERFDDGVVALARHQPAYAQQPIAVSALRCRVQQSSLELA